jgi:hypothetical protein
MPERIEPALTPEEWAAGMKALGAVRADSVFLNRSENAVYFGIRSHDTWRGEPYTGAVVASKRSMAAVIAIANAALPDDDPRKITWEKIDAWIDTCDAVGAWENATIRTFANALASYLPPRES